MLLGHCPTCDHQARSKRFQCTQAGQSNESDSPQPNRGPASTLRQHHSCCRTARCRRMSVLHSSIAAAGRCRCHVASSSRHDQWSAVGSRKAALRSCNRLQPSSACEWTPRSCPSLGDGTRSLPRAEHVTAELHDGCEPGARLRLVT